MRPRTVVSVNVIVRASWHHESQIPLRYLVADSSEAGRRPAASWNVAYHLAR